MRNMKNIIHKSGTCYIRISIDGGCVTCPLDNCGFLMRQIIGNLDSLRVVSNSFYFSDWSSSR